jgi:hypothetical protein
MAKITLSEGHFFRVLANAHLHALNVPFASLFRSSTCSLSSSCCVFDPDLALLIKGAIRIWVSAKTRELCFELGDIFQCPGFLDGALQHEGMGGALPEAEKLYHEHAVVALSFAALEEGVQVGAEAVFSLFIT